MLTTDRVIKSEEGSAPWLEGYSSSGPTTCITSSVFDVNFKMNSDVSDRNFFLREVLF